MTIELHRTLLDLDYDRGRDTVRGRWEEYLELQVHSAAGVEQAMRVFSVDSDYLRTSRYQATIERGGEQVESFQAEDLRWVQIASDEPGIYEFGTRLQMALIPGLAPGDLLRLEEVYELVSSHGIPRHSLGGRPWPVARDEFHLRSPSDIPLEWVLRGPPSLVSEVEHSIREEEEHVQNTWIATSLSSRVFEDSSDGQPVNWIEWMGYFTSHPRGTKRDAFACGPDWESLGEGYAQRVADVFEASTELKRETDELVDGVEESAERIRRIFEHVQAEYRYLGLFEGIGRILPDRASEIHKRGYGDCKNLSAVLIAMLRHARVEAFPALALTRSGGRLEIGAPNLTQFNHFITWADDGESGVWLDPTVDGCPAGVVPLSAAASPVLLLRPGAAGLREIPIEAWSPGVIHVRVDGRIDPDGRLSFTSRLTASPTFAVEVRTLAANQGLKNTKAALTGFLSPPELVIDIETTTLSGADSYAHSLEAEVRGVTRSRLPRTPDAIYLPRRLNHIPAGLPMNGERSTPVDLRSRSGRRETWTIELPDDLALASNDSFSVAIDELVWTCTARQVGKTLEFNRSITWQNELVPAERAESIAAALDEILQRERGHLELARVAQP